MKNDQKVEEIFGESEEDMTTISDDDTEESSTSSESHNRLSKAEKWQREIDNLSEFLNFKFDLEKENDSSKLMSSSNSEIHSHESYNEEYDVHKIEKHMMDILNDETIYVKSPRKKPAITYDSETDIKRIEKIMKKELKSKSSTFNGVKCFLKNYLTSCKQNQVTPISELVDLLQDSHEQEESIYYIDLSYLDLNKKDINVLTNSFTLTSEEIKKMSQDSVITCKVDPKGINLSNNNIKDGSSTAGLLCELDSVELLNLSYNNFGPINFLDITESISNFSNLKSLFIGGNSIGGKAAKELLKVIEKFKIEHIDLSFNNLSESCSKYICNVIKNCPLTSLSLRYNKIGAGMNAIIDSLKHNTSLMDIDFTGTDINTTGCNFFEGLKGNTNIRRLCVGFNTFDTDFGLLLSSFISKLKGLEKLDIQNLNVNSKGINGILKSLTLYSSGTLKELILSGNTIGNDEIKPLIDFLSAGKKLEILKLRDCNLKSGGIAIICNLIKDNGTIHCLDLSGNSLKEKYAVARVCDMIRFVSLKVLSISNCRISKKSLGTIALALQTNDKLEKINIDNNKITDKGLIELAENISGNKTISMISLKNTRINMKGAIDFLNIISKNTSIDTVDLRSNSLPSNFNEECKKYSPIVIKF